MTVNHVPEAPQSASGDYAWLGADPGSVADQLYMSLPMNGIRPSITFCE